MTVTSSTLIFTRGSRSIKKPLFSKDGIFLIYAPWKVRYPCTQFTKYDTEIIVMLPSNWQDYFYSIHKDKIEVKKEKLCIRILNQLFFKDIVIEKGKVLGFFVLGTDKIFSVKMRRKQHRQQQPKNIVKDVDKEVVF